MNTISARALSDPEIERVHETSLRVLQGVGVDVEGESIRSKLLTAGAKEGSTNTRIIFPEGMVMDALQRCDRDIVLGSVRGERYELSPQCRFYSSCCIDPFIADYQEGKRPPRLEDCSVNARLIDALDIISMPYKMDVAFSDIPSNLPKEYAVLESNLVFMSNMSKHYICAPHSASEAKIWMEMCEIMANTRLRENRIGTAIVSPLSPLTLDKNFLDIIEVLLPYEIMFMLLPCPQAGATSPFSIAGTAVIFNTENLASIAVIQTLHPGAAVFYHSVGTNFNMKSSLASLGGPEKALCALASVDMGRFYNLPCGAAGTATDSFRYDIQNGAETMSQLLLIESSRANMVTGIGSLGNGMATSPEQILFDCELISLARYLQKGICIDNTRLAFESIERIGPGGDFLMDDLTMKLLRSGEHFCEGSFERLDSPKEKASMYDNLHERVQKMLDSHKPSIPEQRLAALQQYVHKMKSKIAGG